MALFLLNPPPKKRKAPRRRKAGAAKRSKRNPQLAVFANPPRKRRKKGSATMARRRNRKGHFVKGGAHRRRSAPRRRRRRNPPALAAPRRRRRRAIVHRARSRRRHRRNPGVFGMQIPPLKRIGLGVAGAVVTRMVPSLVNKVTPVPMAGATGLAVRAVGAIGLGALVGKFMGAQAGEDFALGGLISAGDEAFHLYAAPSLGMSSYLAPNMGAYLAPGANVRAIPARARGLSGVPNVTRFNSTARF